MSRLAALLRGLGAFLVLVALLFGIPFALWRSVGWPLPHAIPTWSQLKAGLTAHGIPDEVLFKILACVCWVAWIGLVASVATEAGAVIRGRAARRLPLLGFLQPLAANLVATLALAVLVASSRPQQTGVAPLPVALARYHPVVVATGVMAADGHAGRVPGRLDRVERSQTRSYVVARHDTLWGIADRLLGDPLRWREIYRLNEGRPQPDGRSLDDPNRIYQGWSLRLPTPARAPTTSEPSSQTPSHANGRHGFSASSPGAPDAYRVRPGDSLWDIAERELGDGHRWRDIYELNRGRAFAEGQRLEDPDLIRPGWVLRLPGGQRVPPNGQHSQTERHPGPSGARPTPTPTPSHAGGNRKSSPVTRPSTHTTAPTEAPHSPAEASPPTLGLPADALIAGSTAAALLAAAAVATRRRRARRLDFFTDGPAIPPPAEAFVSLLRHRLRGAETDRVSVAVERLARAWEEAGSEPLALLGCIEGLEDVKVILKMGSQDPLERVGPRVADALGCTVEARDVGDGVAMLTLTDLEAGSVSFLPGVRPRFPLLVPLGAIGSSVLHVNLAAVPLTIAGPEAEDAAFAVGVAAAARASPRHLRLAVDATLGESAQRLRGLPHAEPRWADVGVEAVTELRRRRGLVRSEGARDFDELAREAPDVVLPRVLAITATDGALPGGGELGIHVLHVRSRGSNENDGTVVADHGALQLLSEVSRGLGLGTKDVTLTPFRLAPGQIEAGVELLTDAFPPTEARASEQAPASEQATETPGPAATSSPAAEEEEDPSPVVTPMIEAHGDARLSAPSYPVEIRCLGTLRVLADGKEVSRGRSKSFELLARLALRPGENVGRERIAEDLWPEMDPRIQNERLGDAVSGVRQILRSGLDDEREFLQREPGAYRLTPDVVWADVADFEQAIETGRSREDTAGLAALSHAIDLYRGDLLEDRYYEWAEPDGRRLRDQYLGALLLLSERLTAAGDHVGALDAANRGLAMEPLSEAFHARAMRVYAAQDRRDAVVAQYREAARRLEAEGFDSPDELRALCNDLVGSTHDRNAGVAGS